jgi:alpha-beta hydrolase superfamily lysophospholipase
MSEYNLSGHAGQLYVREWPIASPKYLAVLVHGYGEHIGRYEDLAVRLNTHGAVVVGPDHAGHGRSDGERVMIPDLEKVVDDLRLVVNDAKQRYPGLKQVLIGHSMGGLISSRYIQKYGDELACAVLSGPLLNAEGLVDVLLGMEELPTDPLNPAMLSRDDAVGRAYESDDLVWHGPFKRPTLLGFKQSLTMLAKGRTFPCPVCLLHGADDQIVPAAGSEIIFDRLKGDVSDRKFYPGAQHEIFNEINRAEVFDDVCAWIARFI